MEIPVNIWSALVLYTAIITWSRVEGGKGALIFYTGYTNLTARADRENIYIVELFTT